MSEQIFNLETEQYNGADNVSAIRGEETEVKNSDNEAFYFITVVFLFISTITIFKAEIINLLF